MTGKWSEIEDVRICVTGSSKIVQSIIVMVDAIALVRVKCEESIDKNPRSFYQQGTPANQYFDPPGYVQDNQHQIWMLENYQAQRYTLERKSWAACKFHILQSGIGLGWA